MRFKRTQKINKDNVDNIAYAVDVQPPSAFDNSDGGYEGITNGDYFDEGETKQGSVAPSLNYSNDDDYIDMVDIDSEDEFQSSYPKKQNSQNFMDGPQRPDTMGMAPVQEAAALKNTKMKGSCSRTNNVWH